MKLILLIVGFVIISNCTGSSPSDNRIDLLKSFTREVKCSTSDSNQEIIRAYFSLDSDDDKEKIRNEYLNLIRNEIIDGFVILPYSEAVDKFNEVHLIQDTDNKNDIFIVKISKGSDYVYIKMVKDKIESVSPMTKGNVIVGWF